MFFITSIFLVCCEFYSWTVTLNPKLKSHDASEEETEIDTDNTVVSEEDFPTLKEWLDDRDVLYQDRLR